MSYQHTRQHLPVRGFASAATARKLITASQRPAPFVLSSTMVDEEITQKTSARISMQSQTIAGVQLGVWEVYYLVASPKFPHRFYVVVKHGERSVCSSHEERIQQYCLQAVEQYQADALAA